MQLRVFEINDGRNLWNVSLSAISFVRLKILCFPFQFPFGGLFLINSIKCVVTQIFLNGLVCQLVCTVVPPIFCVAKYVLIKFFVYAFHVLAQFFDGSKHFAMEFDPPPSNPLIANRESEWIMIFKRAVLI